MKKIKDYGLSLALLGLFLVSWALQFVFQMLRSGEDFNQFMSSTMENWQSEFLQLLTFVVLTAHLIHRKSHESKDSADDETHERLVRIEQHLKEMKEHR